MDTLKGKNIIYFILLHYLILAFAFWTPLFEGFYSNIIAFVLFIFVLTLFKDVRLTISKSFNPTVFKKGSFYLALFFCVISFYIVAAIYYGRGIDLATTWYYLTHPHYTVPDRTFYKLLLFSIGLVVIRPIMEEIIYRVLIQGYLQSKFNKWIALFATSFIFGIMHFDNMIHPGIHGLVYGFLNMKFKSIYPSLVLHMLWNLYALFYFNYI
ncbi:CPBP family intramembrane glutamic endopeptidase [Sutcliffiella sp. NC1]|uniref:CPBP family intramembrane glutamic endopeptidase n=1 Tax=Sutcliffiella sp. NC1 TaxID=3004096 RepID=UPI0022DD4004|nr:type II CAAX endopeptidase family protein [Sutcliffiella sp. NC1]WBL16974.1 type II CAAX endopeptidase family protein [Sutcliffiella sp. NC1]